MYELLLLPSHLKPKQSGAWVPEVHFVDYHIGTTLVSGIALYPTTICHDGLDKNYSCMESRYFLLEITLANSCSMNEWISAVTYTS